MKRLSILFLAVCLIPAFGITISWRTCNERSMKANRNVSAKLGSLIKMLRQQKIYF